MKTSTVLQKEIEDLRGEYEKGTLYPNPAYQREATAWNINQKSKLILSLLQDYPIGQVIGYRKEAKKKELVDGLQRISTIINFINNTFSLTKKDIANLLNLGWTLKSKGGVKFKDLEKNLQDKLMTTNISVVMLENWSDDEVTEYFRRLQSGTPLKGTDSLWTIDNILTEKVKEICENKKILLNLGLIHGNGQKSKNHRILYHSILTAIYLADGGQLGSPKKTLEYYESMTPSDANFENLSKIEAFLSEIMTTDRNKFDSKGLKSDLIAMLNLVILNRFERPIDECKDFIINFCCGQAFVKDSPKSTKNHAKMVNYLLATNLKSLYDENKELFEKFSRLRSGGHNMKKVSDIVDEISDLKNSLELV